MRLASISLLMMFSSMLLRAATAEDALLVSIRAFESAFQAWSGAGFGRAAASLEKLPKSPERDYWLGVSKFHESLHHLGNGAEIKAAAATDAAILALERLIEKKESNAEAHALLGTLYGMKIDGSIFRAVRYGPSVERHRKAALEHGSDNPRVLYLVGMCQFHTNRMEEAATTLAKAAECFEHQPNTVSLPNKPAWGRSSCLCFLGQAYEKLGRQAEALDCFQKALKLHPTDRLAAAGAQRLRSK
ncbi:MAG: tetratricopeptide repeat protein [Verrucomicrobiaceae bacterium]|nr:tetratricopeptide repeat protein [Verrucomicrobiaceae bacterium]